ncbi:hypothetical protein L596_001454 [Steinernema carpocapsae]|uniref:Uncharacterized protein n=1 Tax=Steinernema carpocapsae TaxID=34508 RepID=A0A4U8UNB9_STECR|nr:hypothetical protein L596_001454 [Steinernema carpocapsae]
MNASRDVFRPTLCLPPVTKSTKMTSLKLRKATQSGSVACHLNIVFSNTSSFPIPVPGYVCQHVTTFKVLAVEKRRRSR